LGRVSDHSAWRHRGPVAGAEIAQTARRPLAIAVNNLDAMRGRALDAVATTCFHSDDRLRAVHEELGCLLGPLVGRNLSVQTLPFVTVRVAQTLQPDQPAISNDQGVAN